MHKVRSSVPKSARLRLMIRGAVQGVGFRPFVHRLATDLHVTGWVNNSPEGVCIEAEGKRATLDKFLSRIESEKPPHSFIQSLEPLWLDVAGYENFEIRESEANGSKTALVLPDIAICPDCLREILDPHNRRYRYPFTNCTHCGPRFSIIESLPYDRANTSMKLFAMCPECEAEYHNPNNRRFHAQPNACPSCGPHLEFWSASGEALFACEDALLAAARAIALGKIVAVKGLGGFHLMVDARNDKALRRLRERKHREEKPFALIFPSLESIKEVCAVTKLEERLLCSPEAPIVLLRKLEQATLFADSIAPGNLYLGAMLPYTPLHYLLMTELGFPAVATSGNLSDEPICTDEHEAIERLGKIADAFLVHNRPIVRHVDDSVVHVMADREIILRRARGYAPLPINIQSSEFRVQSSKEPFADKPETLNVQHRTILAVGAHLKNSIALAKGPNVFISQHIGDLESVTAFETFIRTIPDFERLYDCRSSIVAMDAHPDYLSSRFAKDFVGFPAGRQSQAVQHHLAHVLACMAENELKPPVLGVAWDGTGYGLDGTVWGGEFFQITSDTEPRVAHLRQFRLPGGDAAAREPRRVAMGLLHKIFGERAFEMTDLAPVRVFSTAELAALKTVFAMKFNAPLTSSIGRLFDGVAGLIGLRQQNRYEGQAAMELEFALSGEKTNAAYSLPLAENKTNGHSTPLQLDWAPMIENILDDLRCNVRVALISAKFHNALANAIVAVARNFGIKQIALSGGCFQNRYLTERTIKQLRRAGFRPYWHQRVPPNDGGIALGQVIATLRAKNTTRNTHHAPR